MQNKDFDFYELISDAGGQLKLEFKKGTKIRFFFLFKMMPVIILVFGLGMPENFRRDIGDMAYWVVILSGLAIIFAFVLHRYTSGIIFRYDGVILRLNICYFGYDKTVRLNLDDEIIIQKNYGGQFSTSWIFYLVQQGKKRKRLFSIPAGLTDNLVSRDNFIAVFEQKYKVKTMIRE